METRKPLSAKIVVGSQGLGVPDPDLVQKRAWEVAQIQEHEFPTSSDWEEARRELHGRTSAIEVGGAKTLDFVQGVSDSAAALVIGEERSLGEELVREGMEEAEHERMLLARREGDGHVEWEF